MAASARTTPVTNPLVSAGLVPENLADILAVSDPQMQPKRRIIKARVLTEDEFYDTLKEKERKEKEEQERKEKNRTERLKKKEEREKIIAEKKEERIRKQREKEKMRSDKNSKRKGRKRKHTPSPISSESEAEESRPGPSQVTNRRGVYSHSKSLQE